MRTRFSLRILIVLALLTAICAVFKAFLSIPLNFTGIKTVELSLAPIPVMLAGVFFGPLAGGMVGFAGETAGFFMGLQSGGYNPAFSVSMGIFGIIAGIFYLRAKNDTFWRAAGMTAAGLLVCTLALNAFFVWLFYGVPLYVLVPTRAITAAIELPVFSWLMMILIKNLRPVVKERFNKSSV